MISAGATQVADLGSTHLRQGMHSEHHECLEQTAQHRSITNTDLFALTRN